jgi:hypothetical protein
MPPTGFFEEAPGALSMMRLMAFTAVCAGIVAGLASIWLDSGTGIAITTLFLGTGFGGKVLQRAVEPSTPPHE